MVVEVDEVDEEKDEEDERKKRGRLNRYSKNRRPWVSEHVLLYIRSPPLIRPFFFVSCLFFFSPASTSFFSFLLCFLLF